MSQVQPVCHNATGILTRKRTDYNTMLPIKAAKFVGEMKFQNTLTFITCVYKYLAADFISEKAKYIRSGNLFSFFFPFFFFLRLIKCPLLALVCLLKTLGGACGVMVIVVGNRQGDTSSNPGRGWLHFT